MAKARNPNRDTAKKTWLESGGKATTKELAAAAGVSEARVRKWKSEDEWQGELDRKKRGGQPGNRNAAGHGAPKGNKNAETHGAYSTVHLENLSPEEREYIGKLTLNTDENMLRELQILSAKERDLSRKFNEYLAAPGELFVDRVVEMIVPKEDGEEIKMRTVSKTGAFERAMKVLAEYNKTQGRLLKLIDTMQARDVNKQRLDLDERKHALAKQRLTGEYNIDPETGELADVGWDEDE